MTKSQRMRESAVMISSTMPSAKYSCSGSPLILANGNTAIDGLSGSGRAGGSATPACAELSEENLSEGFPANFGSNDADFTLSPPAGRGERAG